MKILTSFLIAFCLATSVLAQTKTTTTTAKKTTTTTTKKPAVATKKPATTVSKTTTTTPKTTTVAKPSTTTVTTPTPTPTPAVVVPEVQQHAKTNTPPSTGPVGGTGPKSYDTPVSNTNKTSKPTTKTPMAKVPRDKKTSYNGGKQSYFGFRGGYNLGTAEGIETIGGAGITGIKSVYQPGYMGGLVLNLGISSAFSIQPEVLYSQQGAAAKLDSVKAGSLLSLVQVPLLFKLALGASNTKIFINAGPYFSYKLKQQSFIDINGNVTKDDVDFVKEYDSDGIKDNVFDFGALAGAGVQLGLGKALLTIEGRYQYGMADPQLYKDGKPAEVGNLGHLRIITGTVGLLFPLGK